MNVSETVFESLPVERYTQSIRLLQVKYICSISKEVGTWIIAMQLKVQDNLEFDSDIMFNNNCCYP